MIYFFEDLRNYSAAESMHSHRAVFQIAGDLSFWDYLRGYSAKRILSARRINIFQNLSIDCRIPIWSFLKSSEIGLRIQGGEKI